MASEFGEKVTWDNRTDSYRHFIWNYDTATKIGAAYPNAIKIVDPGDLKNKIQRG